MTECMKQWGVIPEESMEVDGLFEVSVTDAYGVDSKDDSVSEESYMKTIREEKDQVTLNFGVDWSADGKSIVDLDNVEFFAENSLHFSSKDKSKAKAKKEGEATLSSCVEKFLCKEQLAKDDMWNCPKCKTFVQAFKKLDLWKLPDVLVVHMKRFSYATPSSGFGRYFYGSSCGSKIDTPVRFPLEGLDLSRFIPKDEGVQTSTSKYTLFGVCNHYGGLGGGHYTAHVKHSQDNKWYCFNDQSVTQVSEADIDNSSAYLLFYSNRQ